MTPDEQIIPDTRPIHGSAEPKPIGSEARKQLEQEARQAGYADAYSKRLIEALLK